MADHGSGSDLGTIIIAGAVGAAVGAVVALLLAPKAGNEMRAELGEKAKGYAEIAREKAGHVAQMARDKVAHARDSVQAELDAEQEAPSAPDAEPV